MTSRASLAYRIAFALAIACVSGYPAHAAGGAAVRWKITGIGATSEAVDGRGNLYFVHPGDDARLWKILPTGSTASISATTTAILTRGKR